MCALGEDFQDDTQSIEALDLQGALELIVLHGAENPAKHDRLGMQGFDSFLEGLELPLSDKGARIWVRPALHELVDEPVACRGDQRAHLGQVVPQPDEEDVHRGD